MITIDTSTSAASMVIFLTKILLLEYSYKPFIYRSATGSSIEMDEHSIIKLQIQHLII
jgi:hypothetical protein